MNETQAQIDNFPDGMIGFTEMHEAGIRLEHMYPLEKNRAVELYREGAEVFILNGNPDHPEQAGQILAETENVILGHDGIFGITKTEWEIHKEREAVIARKEKLEQDSAENVDTKALEAEPITVAGSTAAALGLTFVFVLPAAVLIAGAVVVLLRRRR